MVFMQDTKLNMLFFQQTSVMVFSHQVQVITWIMIALLRQLNDHFMGLVYLSFNTQVRITLERSRNVCDWAKWPYKEDDDIISRRLHQCMPCDSAHEGTRGTRHSCPPPYFLRINEYKVELFAFLSLQSVTIHTEGHFGKLLENWSWWALQHMI
jgi:hypothetical protein